MERHGYSFALLGKENNHAIFFAPFICNHKVQHLSTLRWWKLSRDNPFEIYREQLFDPARLSQREWLFKNVTLPSLVNQSKHPAPEWFSLLVITSDQLPAQYLNSLKEILQPYPWAHIVTVSIQDSITNKINSFLREKMGLFDERVCFTTIRLDDDDALAKTFFENLEEYTKPCFSGFCISFASGFLGVYDESRRQFLSFHDHYAPSDSQLNNLYTILVTILPLILGCLQLLMRINHFIFVQSILIWILTKILTKSKL